MKIWCLFSVENNYDQPDNNLVGWWAKKPSIEELAKFLTCPLDKAQDQQVVAIVNLWQGQSVKNIPFEHSETNYRLQEVEEGVEL